MWKSSLDAKDLAFKIQGNVLFVSRAFRIIKHQVAVNHTTRDPYKVMTDLLLTWVKVPKILNTEKPFSKY